MMIGPLVSNSPRVAIALLSSFVRTEPKLRMADPGAMTTRCIAEIMVALRSDIGGDTW